MHSRPCDAADAGDDAGRRRLAVVHAEGGELADLEERRARVEQAVDALARQQLAARDVPLARLGVAAERDLGGLARAGRRPGAAATPRCALNSSERVSMRDFNAAMGLLLLVVVAPEPELNVAPTVSGAYPEPAPVRAGKPPCPVDALDLRSVRPEHVLGHRKQTEELMKSLASILCCAAGVVALGAGTAHAADIIVSAQDGKFVRVDGRRDLSRARAAGQPGRHRRVALPAGRQGDASKGLEHTVQGPPQAVAVTPDGKLAIVAAPTRYDYAAKKELFDNFLQVVDIEASPPTADRQGRRRRPPERTDDQSRRHAAARRRARRHGQGAGDRRQERQARSTRSRSARSVCRASPSRTTARPRSSRCATKTAPRC